MYRKERHSSCDRRRFNRIHTNAILATQRDHFHYRQNMVATDPCQSLLARARFNYSAPYRSILQLDSRSDRDRYVNDRPQRLNNILISPNDLII